MALPPSIVSGQSSAPAFRDSGPLGTGLFGSGAAVNNIDRTIEARISTKSIKTIYVPDDLPKYHFNIIENEWNYNFGPSSLTAEKIYKIPFPRELTDKHEVNYDTNFNYLSALGSLLDSRVTAAAEAAGKIISEKAGLRINNFKAVTLEVPDFKTHQLSWSLAPKNFREAQNIQRLIFSLKKGMSPRSGAGIDGWEGKLGSNLVLRFPKIYTLYFSPNPQWLFKFKPCVLSSIMIDYTGGSQVPAFYSDDSVSNGNNPPESVVIGTTWVELEYWLSHDFVSDNVDKDFPSSDPLDGMSWYGYQTETTSSSPLP